MRGVVVQARMGSTRLPGKVLLELEGQSVLGHVLERLQQCRNLDRVIVATTTLDQDLAVVHEAERYQVDVFRGDEADVLGRYAACARTFGLTSIMRVTSDCPAIDPALLDEMMATFQALRGRVDFLCNNQPRTFPLGLDAEIFSIEALLEAAQEAVLPAEREHVSPFVRAHPERYRMRCLAQLQDHSAYRVTLDTSEDFQALAAIFAHLYTKDRAFDRHELAALLDQRPEIVRLNAHVAK